LHGAAESATRVPIKRSELAPDAAHARIPELDRTSDENIGEIYHIVLTDAGAIKAYIVSVGGFLGMGTRYVAIDPKAVALTRQDEKTWKATMNANKDQLRAAPEYKYESEWRKR
jgi:PRC-barrel domain